jgi:hypothetical protein
MTGLPQTLSDSEGKQFVAGAVLCTRKEPLYEDCLWGWYFQGWGRQGFYSGSEVCVCSSGEGAVYGRVSC